MATKELQPQVPAALASGLAATTAAWLSLTLGCDTAPTLLLLSALAAVLAIGFGHYASWLIRRSSRAMAGLKCARWGAALGYGTLCIFCAATLPDLYSGSLDVAAQAQMATIRAAAIRYHTLNRSYPRMLSDLAQPSMGENQQKALLTGKGLIDPWGHAFSFRLDAGELPAILELRSGGPDGIPGTSDDLVDRSRLENDPARAAPPREARTGSRCP